MAATMTLDQTQFTKALREYRLYSDKSIPVILNTKAYYVALKAYNYSPIAKRGEILGLGIGETYQTHGKKGKLLKNTKRFVNYGHVRGRLRKIYVGLLRKQGKLAGAKINAETISKHFGRRLSGVGYMRSGWIKAIKAFSKLVGVNDKAGVSRAKGFVKKALPATADLRSEVTIGNLAKIKGGFNGPIVSRMQAALQRAFDEETASMAEYVIRKMQKDADKVNAR